MSSDEVRSQDDEAWAAEAREWLEALDYLIERSGSDRAVHLLRRLQLRAQVRLRDEVGYLASWCELCRRDPQGAAQAAPEIPKAWRAVWEEFNQLDEEFDTADFPAWLVLRNPPLADRLPTPQESVPGYAEALAVAQAIGLPDSERIERRRALQQTHPALFNAYMAMDDKDRALDAFARAIHQIVKEDVDELHTAPLSTTSSRPDEVAAARSPNLRWAPTSS